MWHELHHHSIPCIPLLHSIIYVHVFFSLLLLGSHFLSPNTLEKEYILVQHASKEKLRQWLLQPEFTPFLGKQLILWRTQHMLDISSRFSHRICSALNVVQMNVVSSKVISVWNICQDDAQWHHIIVTGSNIYWEFLHLFHCCWYGHWNHCDICNP